MKKILYIIVLSLAMFGCNKVETPSEQKSGVEIKLTLNGAFASDTKGPINDTYPMEPSNFSAEIHKDGVLYDKWDDMSKMPAVLFLDPASYTFKVQTNGARARINKIPMYRGESSFVVTAGNLLTLNLDASIDCSAASVAFRGGFAGLTNYTLYYYDLSKPNVTLYTLTQAQNEANGKENPVKVYFDKPFGFGVRFEGKLEGKNVKKNVVVFDNIDNKVCHSIYVE